MSTAEEKAILAALQRFAEAVKAKMSSLAVGEPEDQLRAPFETFLAEVGKTLGRRIVCTGETRLANRLGKPDYAIHAPDLLVGYVELKAPGLGADAKSFQDRNREQWKRFSAIPNLIYCDGNEWALYRTGERVGSLVHLSGDISTGGKKAVTKENVQQLLGLITDFLSWSPSICTF